MSRLVVLADSAVHEILISLSKDEIVNFQTSIANYLQRFSVGSERQFQPDAGVINRPSGQRTLFRNFTSPTAVGTKIIVDPALLHLSFTGNVASGRLSLCARQLL